MDDLSISAPDLAPLNTVGHHVVAIGAINDLKRVLKLDCRVNGLQVIINSVENLSVLKI